MGFMGYFLFVAIFLSLVSCNLQEGGLAAVPIHEDLTKKVVDINYKKEEGKPRIAIVSHYTLDKENLGFINLAVPNHQKYARLHGYDYYFRNGTITTKYFWPEANSRTYRLGLYWQKVQATKELLEKEEDGKYVYDYILWIDTDAFFTNIDLTLEEIINQSGKDIFFIGTDDINSPATLVPRYCINSGVYIIKNTPKAHNFIKMVENAFGIYKGIRAPEQSAMADIAYGFLTEEKLTELKANKEKAATFIKNIKWRNCSVKTQPGFEILPMRTINAPYAFQETERVRWNEYSLAAHFIIISGSDTEKYSKVLLQCLEQTDYKERERCNPYNLNVILPPRNSYER